ncbi:hypothetical protein [Virgisporangium aliadipatigenens]|nr:hypothetical protein [Virgisporangium aliadipatigenens]
MAKRSRFSFLRAGSKAVDRADLAWLCSRLVIEIEAPKSSGIMLEPGPAERILLSRVRTEVGAESYPNAGRSAEDVAEAFATFARQARQGLSIPSADAILQRAQLRRDFGAVARAHPVDRSLEVARPSTVAEVYAAAKQCAAQGVSLLLTGPPGQGKSWACDQLVRTLMAAGWLVAEHYCYLAETLDERDERVQAETVFGSLLGRLADAEPTLVDTQRPRYAADEVALANAVGRAMQLQPDRRVALVVDGLDHVARIMPARPGTDPSAALASALAALELPVGSVLVVLTQPGDHLVPLQSAGARTVAVPSLTAPELGALAAKRGLVLGPATPTAIVDEHLTDGFLAVLEERSRGNALYATYLCREVTLRPYAEADPVEVLRALPPFDGTLRNYYTHLTATLGPGAGIAEVVGLLDFPVTRTELAEMRPDLAYRLDDALATLAPVVVERAAQGGVRVYHESFARYLRRRVEANPGALAANLRFVIDWLAARGFYHDERAFRFLLPTLAAARRDKEVLDLVDVHFAANAVAGGHPASAIAANLSTAASCAGRLGDLPALTRCIELAGAAKCFEDERLDSALAAYVDVPMALLGSEEFASRLMFDGKVAVPPRAGLLLCAAIDAAGAVAPWQDYLTAFARWRAKDTTSFGPESDRKVTLAWARGQLRQASTEEMRKQSQHTRIARFLNSSRLHPDDVVTTAADVLGLEVTAELINVLNRPEDCALALAELVYHSAESSAGELLTQLLPVATRQCSPGNAHRLLKLGVAPDDVDGAPVSEARAALIALTQEVTSKDALHVDGQVSNWLDRCTLAAWRDPTILPTVEGILSGEGWYRCWLRFTLALAGAQAAESDQAQLSLEALRHLTGDLRPFAGQPRACDLYPIHEQIDESLRCAVALLDDEAWPTALAILEQVTEGVGVSLRGEDAGPITPDFLLTLAIDGTTTSARRPATQALIDKALAEGGGRRYYSTLAEYRLMAARFALACGDTSEAHTFWNAACGLMTAYGWHKDITIYEVLDPLPNLIAADPARARVRLAKVQGTCERVVLHTDGKSTRSAWNQWWTFLAKADPAALVSLAVPALLQRCGHVYDLYNRALEDLWRSWHHLVDPIVAAALRLALPMPLDDADRTVVERLADIADGSGTDLPGQMLTLVLARADERPLRHRYTNSDELVAEDNARVEALNVVAARGNAVPVDVEPFTSVDKTDERRPSTPRRASPEDGWEEPFLGFDDGALGVARAIRTWRRRPYESTSPDWSAERFANILGYRLVELAETGSEQEAEAALHSLAGSLPTLDRSGLLTALGDGLEGHGQPRLAAVALALAWTRARGNGGWMNFGGQTELEALIRATRLDADAAWKTVVSEVIRVVSGSHHGSHGVSQALIHATVAGGLTTDGAALDAAFAAWDEAHAVIALRTPRMADEDDPDVPYTPPPLDVSANPTRDIAAIFGEALIGTMAHPGRENKRRALLAFEILLGHRPAVIGEALAATLAGLDEPALLSWLLAVVDDADAAQPTVGEICHDALQRHATSPYLTVRALASRLLGNRAALPPVTAPDRALLPNGALWRPDGDQPVNEHAGGMAEVAAGYRIAAAEELLPYLGQAVEARIAATLADHGVMKAIDKEANELADTNHRRWADAFTGRDALVEAALQRAASGGRAALVAAGNPTPDPVAWEYRLARRLVNDPRLPLAIERTRQPRPNTVAPPGSRDPIWTQARDVAPAIGEQSKRSANADLVLTVGSTALASCDTVQAGRFRTWRVLAAAEEHVVLPVWPEKSDLLRRSGRDRAVELRQPNDTTGLQSRPFASDTAANWFTPTPPLLNSPIPNASRPLIGMDLNGDFLADTPYGLGIHSPVLVPTVLLKLVLGLQPADEALVLNDDVGPALAMITWRSHYETSDYHLPWPRTSGAALVASPPAFERLLAWGGGRLIIREVIHGDPRLASSADAKESA